MLNPIRKVIPIQAVDEAGTSLYAATPKIYPRSVQGRFSQWRWVLVWLTQLVFYGLPWLDWGQRQAVLFDLGARRFYVFGLVLYPHFQRHLVPGWLDKGLKRRHGASPRLDNVVVLAPRAEWIATLPNAKLPDRQDFKTWRHDRPGRIAAWTAAVAAAQQLADEAADWLATPTQDALPL